MKTLSPLRCWRRLTLVTGLLAIALPGWAINQPTIELPPNLLPTTVIENLKQTAGEARQMEDNLQQVISQLEAQKQLYDASHCEGAVNDSGCAQLQQQMSKHYGDMLRTIESALPGIEHNVQGTFQAVSQRMRTEVGYKMTPLGIERMLAAQPARASQPDGNRPQRLSRMFGRLAQLVSQHGRGDNLAVMAAGIYWDTRQVLEDIHVIKQDIAIAKVQLDVFQAYGQITPAMIGTVDNVKNLLFGEEQQAPIPGNLPEPEQVFVSEYERR